ncbi:hypothetical protein PTSG_04025 [Salpingoeca rosetta]|uniref:Holocytochrome c-type synthase n=1 Tax=Salpingoeca rosetta (strain ATCC 50818 / BSB-021) TaxID=946362 RepID=F2U7K0_SALR5|nr:uncharacterized protein PTSG_04025 [Salpingoeca rosetta]EGD83417.1 hypothetical protein PTSG_04025 [Salpingoeca rosetta]|eukprot:XP_004994921.1 hypothetical protein PTSG_04025 [Salpingoeca rosetta]
MGATDMLRGGCPVIHKKGDDGAGGEQTEVMQAPASCASDAGASVNPNNQMLIQEKQAPSIGQSAPLPTNRVISSIPKADFTPAHQEQGESHWHYPSEQMFYNAMKRKGWKPEERDMSTVLAIHNAVNETAWRQVQEWEGLHAETSEEVKLTRFMGRPKDLTPKAFFRGLLGPMRRPFYPHALVCNGAVDEGALDSPTSVLDRVRMGFKRIFASQPPLKSSSVVPTLVTRDTTPHTGTGSTGSSTPAAADKA